VLLLHLDGTNGSTTFPDNSASNHTFTTGGGSLTTTNPKFGTASLTSAGSLYISSPDSADWFFGSGQFTVETWIYPTSAISGVRSVIAQFGGPASQLGWNLAFNGNTLNFFYSTTGTDNPVVTGSYTPTLNTWVHIAADRDASNVLRVYAGGSVVASGTVSATFFDSNRILVVGNDGGVSRGFVGQIDEVRITKGLARYGGAFTPPSAPFPDS